MTDKIQINVMRRNLKVICLILFFWMITSCAVNPVTGKKELALISENQELAMGREYDPQIIQAYGLYEDEKLMRFITEKGRAMGAISHRPHLEYHFRILDSPILNAFAVPGGYVYFTRGILAHFNNEAEFAGVLGHEIGHITARHTVRQQSRQVLGTIALIGAMVVSEDLRNFGDEAAAGLQLLFLKYGRDDETQSDQLGVEYSSKVGYDAREMAGFFNTLKKASDRAGGGSLPTFLSTHPDPGDRNRKVYDWAVEWQRANPGKNVKIKRNEYLEMIDGIIHGEDPRQGYVENDYFYHPTLRFQMPVPRMWRTQNSPSQFQMSPEDGNALMVLTFGKGNTVNEAANDFIQTNQLSEVERKNVTVYGNPAVSVVSDHTPPAGQGQASTPLRILSYFIQYNNNIYHIYGLSRRDQFNDYFMTFNFTMTNFRTLTDAAKLNKKPVRVRVVPAGNTAPLRQLLLGQGMRQEWLEDLAMLNGLELTDTVERGTLFKILREE